MNNLEQAIKDAVLVSLKNVLTAKETAQYIGISMSHLYKLTMLKQIPHYKPMNGKCYFNRTEIEKWLQRNRIDVEKK